MTVQSVVMILILALMTNIPVYARNLDIMKDFQGIQYDEIGRPVGMPMGGVGAGSIEITSQGTLSEFRNINNLAARIPSIPGSALWLTYRSGGETKVYPLAGGKVKFEGNFPFAKLEFPDLPVDLTLYAWSPFILHDLKRSAYPVAVFDAVIKNKGNEKADVGLVLSYGTDYSTWLRKMAGVETENIPVLITSKGEAFTGKSASGITFSTKAQYDAAALENKVKSIRKNLEDAYLRSYEYTPLDIRKACNRSYLKSPFGTDTGNAPLNFADMKPGRKDVYGIPFDIVDDQANNGKSIVMPFPNPGEEKVSIPISQKADCLFFFGNCGGWVNDPRAKAEYIVHYKDGSDKSIILRNGYELADWFGSPIAYSPARVSGKHGGGGDYYINMFAVPTDGSKEIKSVDVRQYGAVAPIVFAITIGRLSQTPLTEGVLAMRRTDIDKMSGNSESLKQVSNTDAEYTLAAASVDGANVKVYQIADPGTIADKLSKDSDVMEQNASVYAVEQRVQIAPGKSADVGLLCSWYAPNHVTQSGKKVGHKYEEWFKGSSDVVEEAAKDHDALLVGTKKHYDIVATSTLPKWYREMVQSNFYQMPTISWLTKDGIAFTIESTDGCPLFGTMDVRYYGSFIELAAFPEFDAAVLRQFAAVQDPDGFIRHDLGGTSGIVDNFAFAPDKAPEPVQPRGNRSSYSGYWTNLPIKFCLEVARHYWWTGDKEFLKEMWPHVKRAVTWIEAQDEDGDGLPETTYGYDGWRMIDKCGYDANQWAAMLPAVARLARELDEPDYAFSLMSMHQKALEQIDKYIWTGKYYKQSAGINGSKDLDWVSLIQLAGTWYADVLGYKDSMPGDKVRIALQTMDGILGKDAVYGLTDALNPDGTRINWWICDGQAIGWQYFYASHAMYRGLDDIALRVAQETWQQFTVEKARIPWCQEEFIADPRKPECGYWLLRDMRMGSAIVMSYAAAGLTMDLPSKSAAVKPAEWIWKDKAFVLPVLMPKWLGQVKYSTKSKTETYEITNSDKPLELTSLRLRTAFVNYANVTINARTRKTSVSTDGTVDVGPVVLSDQPMIIEISQWKEKKGLLPL